MKVAIPFKYKFDLNDEVDEFNVKFDPDENDFSKLIDFIQEHKDKRINIEYKNSLDTKTALALAKMAKNIAFRLKPEDMVRADKLVGHCNLFFDSSLACSNFWELNYIISTYHVSDVYIVDDLCYDLPRVSEFCHDRYVNIRAIVNRGMSSTPQAPDSRIIPFVRPNDYDFLEKRKYIDVYEFDCGDPYDFKALKVLYKVFMQDKDWYGNLQELNRDIPFELPNRGLLPEFTKFKSNCKLRCLTGGGCNHCQGLVELAQGLREKGVQLRHI